MSRFMEFKSRNPKPTQKQIPEDLGWSVKQENDEYD